MMILCAAIGLPFVVLGLLYGVLRHKYAEHCKKFGAVILAMMGVLMVLVPLGALCMDHEVPCADVLQAMKGIAGGIAAFVQMLAEIVQSDQDRILGVVAMVVLLADMLFMGWMGAALYDPSTEENMMKWFAVKVAVLFGIFLLLLLCECVVFLVVGIIVVIVELFSSGDAAGILGAVLFLICIAGALGGVTYTVTVRKN